MSWYIGFSRCCIVWGTISTKLRELLVSIGYGSELLLSLLGVVGFDFV